MAQLVDQYVTTLEALNTAGASLTWEFRQIADASPEGTVVNVDPDPAVLVVPDEHLIIYVSLGVELAALSRWASALHETAAAQQIGTPVFYVFLDFVGDPVYLNLSNVTFQWGGHDWLGTGELGGIELPDETADLTAQSVRLTLSVDSAAMLADAPDRTAYRGRDCIIYIAMHDPETLALVDTPEEFWRGFMSVLTMEVGKGFNRATLTCEHWLRISPAVSRYTDAEQQQLHTGDRFFQWLHTVRDPGKWGSKDVGYGGGGREGGPRRGHRDKV